MPTGPGWSTSVGAFMVNGVLYKLNSDGSMTKQTFDGTNYGTATAVNTSDALANQTDWHNDVKTITSIFYSGGFIYYTKSGTLTSNNVLYRRAFEVEDGVVGQQRFTTSTSSIDYRNVRGAFVAAGKLFFATSTGALWGATWNQAGHTAVTGTAATISTAGTGWSSRALFPMQATPPPVNDPPVATASVSCNQLTCNYDATGSTDPENGPLTYDWDFGDGTTHGSGLTTTHTYAAAGDRTVTLIVTDNKGATNSVTRTASATNDADTIGFVASNNNNGNRTNHSIAVPAGTQVGDTLLLFFAANSTGPVYAGPAGWTQVLTQNGSTSVGKVYSRTATAADLGSTVTVTSKNPDGTAYYIRSDTTLAAYRGTGSSPISASAITAQNVASATHQTPTVNAANGTNWLLSFWTDRLLDHDRLDRPRRPDAALRGQRDRQRPHVLAAHRQQRPRQRRCPGWAQRHRRQQRPGPHHEPAAGAGRTAAAQPAPGRARDDGGLHQPDLLLRRWFVDRPRVGCTDLRLELG